MSPRRLPLILALLLALAAVALWWRRPEPPQAVAPPNPSPAGLSDLGSPPDWSSLERFQGAVTRADFIRRMDEVFTVSPAWRDWFQVGEREVAEEGERGVVRRAGMALGQVEEVAQRPPGLVRIVAEGREIDLRVSSLPTLLGEKIERADADFVRAMTGFAIGVTAGLVSMIPGGLGVQEGSMAGVYHLLGVPLQQAILASILFRVMYYFIPFFLSLPSYWRILRTSREVGPTS